MNTLLRAPKLERKHFLALQTLIRLNYARAVRFKMEILQGKPEDPVESTLKLMTLADMLIQNYLPLTITLAVMELHNSPGAFLPLEDARFDFYLQTLSTEIGAEDFSSVPVDQLEALLAPLKTLQAELKVLFRDATRIDPQEIRRQVGLKAKVSTDTSGLLN